MPTKIVVDASALAAVLFGEPEGPKVAEQLGDSALVTPTLFSYEIANICWKKLRRHPEKRAALLEGYSFLGRMEIEELEVSVPEVLRLHLISGPGPPSPPRTTRAAKSRSTPEGGCRSSSRARSG